tara:strand:- start:1353 stop:2192 length:840 start_codon:yes stop_codon:yes gene_type:complete
MRRQYCVDGIDFTEAETCNARRGYYGAISYVDAKIAQILEALERSGDADNTIVLLTSDHGEMQGEHGLWMKKVFFENAIKIPMLAWVPSRFGPRRLSGFVSLIDLLPTMLVLSGTGMETVETVETVDGADLTDAIMGTAPLSEHPLLAELTCEGSGLVLMLRRGNLKYIWSAQDPAMLFDLASDPDECVNISGAPGMADAEAGLRQELLSIWNPDAITAAVRRSQKRRKLVQEAHHATSTAPDWEFRESDTPDDRWMRGQTGYGTWAYGSITRLKPASD